MNQIKRPTVTGAKLRQQPAPTRLCSQNECSPKLGHIRVKFLGPDRRGRDGALFSFKPRHTDVLEIPSRQ